MGAKIFYSTGYKFPDTRLTYIRDAPAEYSGNLKRRMLLLKCDCGRNTTLNASSVTRKLTKSCGCYNKEVQRNNRNKNYFSKHGLSRDPLYKIWKLMLSRCLDETAKDYSDYGGRGIKICKEWLGNNGIVQLKEFDESLPREKQYKPGNELDRIDNDGPYATWNCHWVTSCDNSRNRYDNRWVIWKGENRLLIDLYDEGMISGTVPDSLLYGTVLARIKRGWSVQEALTTISLEPSKFRKRWKKHKILSSRVDSRNSRRYLASNNMQVTL
jgi:hypothetical protein